MIVMYSPIHRLSMPELQDCVCTKRLLQQLPDDNNNVLLDNDELQ